MRAHGEAFYIGAVAHRAEPFLDQQRPGLEQIARWRRRELVAPGDTHRPPVDVDAPANLVPRLVEGTARSIFALSASLARPGVAIW